MATTTPNFGWPVPTSTDLVKDGATAIEALGDGIDTSLVDLKGGTTGQVLAKATSADMDFAWVAQDDSNAIQNAIVDAKGDLIAATANDTPARLAVGTNDFILQAASGESTGLKWGGGWTSYTPTWTSVSGTNPVIGNGTIDAGYRRIGNVVDFWLRLTAGSTTTFGTGSYALSLPVAANDSVFNMGYSISILENGVAWYVNFMGSGVPYGYADQFLAYRTDGANTWSPTFPFTFKQGDRIIVQGSYRVGA